MASVNLIAFGLTPTAIKSVQGCVPHLPNPDQIWEHTNEVAQNLALTCYILNIILVSLHVDKHLKKPIAV